MLTTSLRIVFVTKTLAIQGGGAERVLVEVASGLVQRGHQVTVITSDQDGESSYYPLHHLVKQINLGIGIVGEKTKPLEAIRRMLAMRRVLKRLKPDVAIGFMHSTYIPLGLALKWTGIPLVASEHIGIEYYNSRMVQKFLLNLAPLLVKKITVVSEQIRLAYSPWLRRCMVVISNPVRFRMIQQSDLISKDQSKKVLLSVGRLTEQKNHKCLISAFAHISESVPEWNLRIVGEGELRRELEDQIRELDLENRVQLPGATKSIDDEYANAQLFVLPSLYESFGLATAEAIAHDLPVIGFVDCSGTNELILHNQNGLLVTGSDRIQSLANALKFLMSSPDDLCRLGCTSKSWLVEKYDIKQILDVWEGLLIESINRGHVWP